MVAGAVVVSVNSITDASLHSTAVELTGAIKYSYDRAIMLRRSERIAIDLDQGTWWMEMSASPFALSRELAEGTRGETSAESQAKLDKESGRDRHRDDDELPSEAGMARGFQVEEEELGKPRKIPSGLSVSRVWTAHQEEPFRTGTAYVHFMRGGWAEPALIELVDCEWSRVDQKCADGETPSIITLEVQPLTGRVHSKPERVDPPKAEEPDGREEGDE